MQVRGQHAASIAPTASTLNLNMFKIRQLKKLYFLKEKTQAGQHCKKLPQLCAYAGRKVTKTHQK
jgi:hypothetical protein